jgi:hypothetical protein
MTPPIRPGRRRHRIDIGQRRAGIGQRRLDQRPERLDMRARRNLGDNAAERPMRRLLPGEPVSEDRAITGDERGGGFVAGGFEAEDQGHAAASLHRLGALEQSRDDDAPHTAPPRHARIAARAGPGAHGGGRATRRPRLG